jgi:hypothetical protein
MQEAPNSCSLQPQRRRYEAMMGAESRRLAGISLVVFPSVVYGGASLLMFLLNPNSGYLANPLRQNLFRAGHAHAGVLLVLSLVVLRYVDEARLSDGWKHYVRVSAPCAAILLPVAYFLSVVSPYGTEPNGLIYLAYAGAVILAVGLFVLGVGLLRTNV